ncbi:MAG: hypothetical protein ACT4TC_18745 [Myxococcaceae bacterium]
MSAFRFTFVLVVLLTAGCLDFPSNGVFACDRDAGTDCEDVEVTDPTAVSGRRRHFYVVPAGTSVVPYPPSSRVELRLLPEGTVYTGTADGDAGTFTIPAVPENVRFELRAHNYFVQTSSRFIDLDEVELGRPGRATARTTGTQVVLGNVTGLNPYSTLDSLQISSLGVQLNYFASDPDAGTQTLSNYALDFATNEYPLIDGSKGDVLRVDQLLGNAADGGYSYRSLRKSFSPAAFTMADGQTSTVNGAFTDVAPIQSFTRAWPRSQFDAHKTLVFANPAIDSLGVWVQVLPAAAEYGPYDRYNAPQLASTFNPMVTDIQISLDFANPHPGTEIFVDTVAFFTQSYSVPGAAAYTRYGEISRQDLLSALPAAPLAPRITPVRNAQFSGEPPKSIYSATTITGVGLTPTITWEAPAVGTPTIYKVNIYELSNSNGQTVADYSYDMATVGRSVIIPAGLLTTGRYYFLLILALVDQARSPEHPYKQSFPAGEADAYSSIFTP